LAHIEARLGQTVEAGQALRALAANDAAALPFDMEWLCAMSLLAETAVLLGETETARGLYHVLEPWSELNVVDMGEGIRGAVARYLGMLAEALGWFDL